MRWLISIFERQTFGAARSSKWSAIRNTFLASHNTCAVCGKKDTLLNKLNVHHVIPYHVVSEKELDPSNFITLCRTDHLLFGHLNSWKSWNENVREDAAIWSQKLSTRPS